MPKPIPWLEEAAKIAEKEIESWPKWKQDSICFEGFYSHAE